MKRIAFCLSASAMLLVSFAFSANAAVRPNPTSKPTIIRMHPGPTAYHISGMYRTL